MQIHVATVMHEYGGTGFAARTKEGLVAKLMAFCLEHTPVVDTTRLLLAASSPEDFIQGYFERNPNEILIQDTADLGD